MSKVDGWDTGELVQLWDAVVDATDLFESWFVEMNKYFSDPTPLTGPDLSVIAAEADSLEPDELREAVRRFQKCAARFQGCQGPDEDYGSAE